MLRIHFQDGNTQLLFNFLSIFPKIVDILDSQVPTVVETETC